MTEYVSGFLFDENRGFVCLIRKTKPEWQAGKLNGVGGKIEPGETPLDAMRREFKEETGVEVADWNHYATLSGSGFRVYFYRAFSDHLFDADSTTDEDVEVWFVAHLVNSDDLIPSLKWLVPMALSMDEDKACLFEVNEIY